MNLNLLTTTLRAHKPTTEKENKERNQNSTTPEQNSVTEVEAITK